MRVSIFAAYQAPSVVNEMVSSSESAEKLPAIDQGSLSRKDFVITVP